MTNKWKVSIEVEVSHNWIEDGFDLANAERRMEIEEAITAMLPYAYEHEMKVKVSVREQEGTKAFKDAEKRSYNRLN